MLRCYGLITLIKNTDSLSSRPASTCTQTNLISATAADLTRGQVGPVETNIFTAPWRCHRFSAVCTNSSSFIFLLLSFISFPLHRVGFAVIQTRIDKRSENSPDDIEASCVSELMQALRLITWRPVDMQIVFRRKEKIRIERKTKEVEGVRACVHVCACVCERRGGEETGVQERRLIARLISWVTSLQARGWRDRWLCECVAPAHCE